MSDPQLELKRLVNPFGDGRPTDRIQAELDSDIFTYFFRYLLVGDRGPRQTIINLFFVKFYQACLDSGLQPVWDEQNEAKIVVILERLNFGEAPAKTTKKKSPTK